MGNTVEDNEGEGTDETMAHVAVEALETLIIDTKIKIEGEVELTEKGSFWIIENEVKKVFL